jgi:hypothetical protein
MKYANMDFGKYFSSNYNDGNYHLWIKKNIDESKEEFMNRSVMLLNDMYTINNIRCTDKSANETYKLIVLNSSEKIINDDAVYVSNMKMASTLVTVLENDKKLN